MIENKSTKRVETNISDIGDVAFTINNTAKMFRLLSDKLYSNKIKAVIRELSTNALDANIDNNNIKEPIFVHLPNNVEPWFQIKDSGKGLTKEEMQTIFTQYGTSTKTNSNKMVGALGLGSKSPFAYVDSFSVISRTNDNIMRSYVCYLNEHGEPKLSFVGEAPFFNKSTGLEIKFPVDRKNFIEFKNEAEFIYRPFLNKPKVVGNSSYNELIYENVILCTENWKLIKTGYKFDTIQLAVMGGIEYPIRKDKIIDKVDIKVRHLLDSNLILNFKLGDIQFTPSREELEYTDITVNQINSLLLTIYSKLEEEYQSKVANSKTLFKALQFNNEFQNHNIIGQKFNSSWKGIKLNKFIELNLFGYNSIIKYYYNSKYSNTIKRDEITNKFDIPKKNNSIIVYNDIGNRSAVNKARTLVTKDKDVYLIDKPRLATIVPLFTNEDYILASSIDTEKVKKKKEPYKGKFYKKYIHDSYEFYQWQDNYNSLSYYGVNTTDEFFFIPIKKNSAYLSYNIYHLINLVKKMKLVKQDFKLYGVQSSHIKSKKFKEMNGINFLDYILPQLISNQVFIDEKNKIKNNILYKDLSYKWKLLIMDESEVKFSLFLTNIRNKLEQNKLDKKDDISQSVFDYLKSINKISSTTVTEVLDNRYPLVKMIPLIYEQNKKDIQDYINMIDIKLENVIIK